MTAFHQSTGQNLPDASVDSLLDDSSSSEQEEEYDVSRIMFHTENDDGKLIFLVKWEGYPDERCTFEQIESFTNNETIDNYWQQVERNDVPRLDEVERILAKMEAYAHQKAERKKQRENRRYRPEKTIPAAISHETEIGNHSEQGGSSTNGPGASLRNSQKTVPSHVSPAVRGGIVPKVFHDPGIAHRARRKFIQQSSNKRKSEPATLFKSLRTQWRNQKAARDEPVPDIQKIRLKSVSEIVPAAGEDVAHILPLDKPRKVSQSQIDTPLTTSSTISAALYRTGGPSNTEGTTNLQKPPDKSSSLSSSHNTPIFISRGRYVYEGELLVHLSLAEETVGDVRLGGLSNMQKQRIYSLKVNHRIGIKFRQEDIVKREQYERLCMGRLNVAVGNGWIIGYEDTQPIIAEFAQHLEKYDVAALWFHPREKLVFVAYSALSRSWRTLDTGQDAPPEATLRLLVRNNMPGPESLNHIEQTLAQRKPNDSIKVNESMHKADGNPQSQPESNEERQEPPEIPDARRSHVTESGDEHRYTGQALNRSSTMPESATRPIRHEPSSPALNSGDESIDRTLPESECGDDMSGISYSPITASVLEAESSYSDSSVDKDTPFALPATESEEIDELFKNRFNITFQSLTLPVGTTPMSDECADSSLTLFYLEFPSTRAAELAAFTTFLSGHISSRLICTNMDRNGWDDFRAMLKTKGRFTGVIIFHGRSGMYSELPGLAALLKIETLNVFNISLADRVPFSESQRHIERLFPRGTVLLITEGTMMEQPDQANSILTWFASMAKQKRGTWKVFLRPNIKKWLRKIAMHAKESQKMTYLRMFAEVDQLSRGQETTYHPSSDDDDSEAESFDGYEDEVGRPGVLVSPARISGYNPRKDHSPDDQNGDIFLVDFFAAWACQNVQNHRRFVAVSPYSGPEMSRRGHIEVLKPEKYMQQARIPT